MALGDFVDAAWRRSAVAGTILGSRMRLAWPRERLVEGSAADDVQRHAHRVARHVCGEAVAVRAVADPALQHRTGLSQRLVPDDGVVLLRERSGGDLPMAPPEGTLGRDHVATVDVDEDVQVRRLREVVPPRHDLCDDVGRARPEHDRAGRHGQERVVSETPKRLVAVRPAPVRHYEAARACRRSGFCATLALGEGETYVRLGSVQDDGSFRSKGSTIGETISHRRWRANTLSVDDHRQRGSSYSVRRPGGVYSTAR